MSKRKVDLISPSKRIACSSTNDTPVAIDNQEADVDWTKCFICEKDTKEKLQCSQNAVTANAKQSYENLAKSILDFKSIGNAPINVQVEKLSGGKTLSQSLYDNSAKFHKTCKKKFGKDKLERAKKAACGNETDTEKTRDTRGRMDSSTDKCFFCDLPADDQKGQLYPCHSGKTNNRVTTCSRIVKDSLLQAKLLNGDMHAQDALYHRNCLTNLYKKAQRIQLGDRNYTDEERKLHGIAFAEIVSYIEEQIAGATEIPMFKLSDLLKFYRKTLQDLGLTLESRIHSTRFKDRILYQVEGLSAHNDGKEVLLVCNRDIGEALESAACTNYDDEGYILSMAASIIRRDILNMSPTNFNGSFDFGCQKSHLPATVMSLITAITQGSESETNNNRYYKQATLTLGQLLAFNTNIRTRKETTSAYHSNQREPPISIYVAQMIHQKTRKLGIVDKLSKFGLCISKDRLIQISTAMGNRAIEMHEREGVVAPISLRFGLFSTAAVDNIDVNPKSSMASTSLHGTAASINQHINGDNVGLSRDIPGLVTREKKLKKLPTTYTDVLPCHLPSTITMPEFQEPKNKLTYDELKTSIEEDQHWLQDDCHSSWAVFHSKRCDRYKLHADLSALLPIWRDESKCPSTIRHTLEVIKQAIAYLNPDQTPVVAFDQPLYAIAKRLQWHYPEQYGASAFVIMMGALHIEMAFMSAIGDWLEDSGWTAALSNAKVSTPGNQSLVSGHDVAITKYCHQVTACALHQLMHQSFTEAASNDHYSSILFDAWRSEMEMKIPQFQFWSIALKMQLDYLLFLRAIRSGDFRLYKFSISKLLPWLFAFDHFHYARWLSIHLYDMEVVDETDPEIFNEFLINGNFVVSRTRNPFSAMGIDQRHEQLNKDVKGDGGAVGLTENEDMLRRWMVCTPEIARSVAEFEAASIVQENEHHKEFHHHEDSGSFQQRFQTHVDDLVNEFVQLGNPFIAHGDTSELIQLGTRDVMSDDVVKTVKSVEALGIVQYEDFRQSRIVQHSVPIDAPITKNKLRTFKSSNTKGQSNSKSESKEIKIHVRLFSQMYISTQIRGGNMDDFFSHETLKYPPSLSKAGEIRSGNKAELLVCLKTFNDTPAAVPPIVDSACLEGSVIVNMTKPNANQSFKLYAKDVFTPQVEKYAQQYKAQRIHVVFDIYKPVSLKEAARIKRGKGVRRKVEPNSIAPSNWGAFLRINDNKSELFRFLSHEILTNSSLDNLVSAFDDISLCNSMSSDISLISPTNHEEGDTRVFLHVNDMAMKGYRKIAIRTVDTDVLVLAISLFSEMKDLVDELWIDFGTGKSRAFYAVHSMYIAIGQEKANAIRFFHSFTGCDQVSFMAHVTKKSAWKVWQIYPEVTKYFIKLSNQPSLDDVKEALPTLERFTVLLYNTKSNLLTTNECRRDLFCKGRMIDNIPPTSAALAKHVHRAAYIAGHVWGQCLVPMQNLPSPEDWGWMFVMNKLVPNWTSLPEASRAMRELIKCTCKAGNRCRPGCKCVNANLPCTELCLCKGDCERE